MSELAKTVQHYRSSIEIWWARIKRGEQERADRQLEAGRRRRAEQQERAQKMAAGELQMPQGWHQHPNDPPGYLRWWDGARWTEHTQQSRAAMKATGRKESGGLAIAGFITFIVGLFFWPIFLATFVIGIILATKPGRGGDGALLIVLSVIGPILSIAGCVALVSGS